MRNRVPLFSLFTAWLLALGAALAGSLALAQDSDATITDVRVGVQPGGAQRIVLEFAPAATEDQRQFRWFTLPQPARVVIDLADVTFAQSPNFIDLPPNSPVTGLRAGRFRPDTVRMVLDLTKPARVNLFTIPPRVGPEGGRGMRLVIDVVPTKPGQKPTDIPPPPELVEDEAAPPVRPTRIEEEPAPVVPRQVSRPTKAEPRRVVVTLDPGHGGVDPGGCGRVLKLCEKNIVLDVAKQVGQHLRTKGYDVVLTRTDDTFIPLAERVRIAQRAKSDLFVSFHADIHPTKTNVIGATTYVVSDRASDQEAARLARSENAGDILAGVAITEEPREVQDILIAMVQRETRNNSSFLAQKILTEMGKETKVRRTEPLFAGFRVLKAPDVPSVLIEMGYLSNPREERQLNTPAFRKRLARRIADGIHNYITTHVHY